MRSLCVTMVLALVCSGGLVFSQEAPSQSPPSPDSQPVTIQDLDYQIQLVKQYIEQYQNQAFLLDQKAQDLMSHDFMGYRNAETMSQTSQAIADDLKKHLQELEKQRAEMVQKQGQKQPQASK